MKLIDGQDGMVYAECEVVLMSSVEGDPLFSTTSFGGSSVERFAFELCKDKQVAASGSRLGESVGAKGIKLEELVGESGSRFRESFASLEIRLGESVVATDSRLGESAAAIGIRLGESEREK